MAGQWAQSGDDITSEDTHRRQFSDCIAVHPQLSQIYQASHNNRLWEQHLKVSRVIQVFWPLSQPCEKILEGRLFVGRNRLGDSQLQENTTSFSEETVGNFEVAHWAANQLPGFEKAAKGANKSTFGTEMDG